MKRIIVYSTSSRETRAAVAFLSWQLGREPYIEENKEISLTVGHGSPSVVLMDGDTQVAVGFWGIIKYWQENGLELC